MPRVPPIIGSCMRAMAGYWRIICWQDPVITPGAAGAADRTRAAVAPGLVGLPAEAAPAVPAVTEITAAPISAATLAAFIPRPGPHCQPESAGRRAAGRLRRARR